MKKLFCSIYFISAVFVSNLYGIESIQYHCYQWQPDEDVIEFYLNSTNNFQSFILKNKRRVATARLTETGISLYQTEYSTKDLVTVASSTYPGQVRLSVQKPRFSLSCYPL